MTEPSTAQEPGLGDYMAMLWRRLPLMLAVIIGVVVSAGVVMVLQPDYYRAKAGVVIQPATLDPLTGESTSVRAEDANQVIQNEIPVITGERVRALVEKQVGASAPKATVVQLPNSTIVQIAVEDSSATDAVKVANAYVAAYFNIRKLDQLAALGASTAQVQGQLDKVQALLAKVQAEIASKPAEEIAAAQARFGAEVASLQGRVSTLSAQVDALKIAAGTATGGVKTVGPVRRPTASIAPSTTKTLGLAIAAGLILAIGLAFLAEYLDGTVKDARDLARALPTVPLLAVIPRTKSRRNKRARRKRKGDDDVRLFSDGPAQQAYETAAIAIVAEERDHPIHSIIVASPEKPAATQAIGLAAAITSMGRTVLLIDASPRGRTLPDKVVPADSGLAGAVDGRSQIVQDPSNARLFVLGAGEDPQTHLPALPELRQALDLVGDAADIAILSTDPILTYSDAMILAGETSGTVLVARTRRTTRRSLQQSLDRLTTVRSDVIGVILDDG